MNRVRVAWSGFNGGPGVSTFYLGNTTTDMTALKAFFNSVSTYTPGPVTFTIPALGDQINDTDGLITGSWNGTNGGTVTSSGGSAAYAGAAGLCVDWLSSAIIDGRRRQGRTFIVPAVTGVFQSDGTIAEGIRTLFTGYATTLIAAYAGELKVWSRPYAGRAASPGHAAKPPRVGAAVQVISARVPDISAVLRSRRQ